MEINSEQMKEKEKKKKDENIQEEEDEEEGERNGQFLWKGKKKAKQKRIINKACSDIIITIIRMNKCSMMTALTGFGEGWRKRGEEGREGEGEGDIHPCFFFISSNVVKMGFGFERIGQFHSIGRSVGQSVARLIGWLILV